MREVSTERNKLQAEIALLQMAASEGANVTSQVREAQRKLTAAQSKLDNSKSANSLKHTIQQEMDRLLKWKNNPEAFKGEQTGKPEKGKNGEWQVPYVVLPVKGEGKDAEAGKESIVVAYSELNTMPDFFGNPETIANTKKSKVLGLLQGVREQSYNELGKLYEEIFKEDINKLKGVVYDDSFKGAKGPTGKAWVDAAYEIRKESEVDAQTQADTGEKKGASERYFAALERNACHFAPYSWDAWQGYHIAAVADAKASNQAKVGGDKKKAEDLANKAMVKSGFGEHYLQDSFAGGHLIDKTRVMQTFAQWVQKDKGSMGSTDTAQAQWAMLSTVANTDLKANPQAVDDMMHRGQANKVEDATGKVGMKAQPEIQFMMWWRRAAFKDSDMKHLTADEASTHSQYPVSANEGRQLMNKLVAQNFAKKTTKGWFSNKKEAWSLNQSMIDVLKRNKKGEGQGAYQAKVAYGKMDAKQTGDHHKEAHEFNLAAYNMFLSNAYVQGATKYFHDKYCKEGVEVITGEGADIGRIYGDANMLNAGAQKGVEYSAETSRRSRDAVFNTIDTGADPTGIYATADIRKRFPAKVKPGPNDAAISLEDWNAQKLFTEYDKGLLNPASSNKARLGYKFMGGGGISGGNAIDVEKITQHDAGPF